LRSFRRRDETLAQRGRSLQGTKIGLDADAAKVFTTDFTDFRDFTDDEGGRLWEAMWAGSGSNS